MREIKFRVWDKLEKKYSKVPFWNIDENGHIHYGNAEMKEAAILEQYTGVKDKNGIEIYEGDIIPMSFEVKKHSGISYGAGYILNGVVEYDEDSARFMLKYEENEHRIIASEFGWYIDRGLEIIGNIHENK